MTNLSPYQQVIVEAPIGTAMQVVASAGSGKTRVLTERVRFIISNTKKDSVIALTFTNKAAEEMLDRLDGIEQLEERTWVSTIHSIAQKILEKYSHTIGLPSELHIYDRDQDRMEVFLQSLRDDGVNIDDYLNVIDQRELRNREKLLQRYMEYFSQIKRELLTETEVKEKFSNIKNIWKIYQDYQNSLLNSGGIDYDDILVYAYQLLLTHDWIGNIYKAKYKHICIDEAQDLNKVQYEFIKALCGDSIKSIMMVGDPNQMIYGFNGSSSKYFCDDFLIDFSATTYFLNKNYRSTKAIINIANKLKPNSQEEHEFALDGISEIREFSNEETEANWVLAKINELLLIERHNDIEGKITTTNMVVIARNRFVFGNLIKQLNENNIPFHLRKAERRSEPTSLFGKILDYSIRFKLNPKDWVDGKNLCALLKIKPPNSWGESDLLLEWSKLVLKSKIIFPELQSTLLEKVNELSDSEPNIRKFIIFFEQELRAQTNVSLSVNNRHEIERSLVELQEFKKHWLRFRQKNLGKTLQAFRNAMSLGQLAEDSVVGGLTLSTVHTMKGLEKDIVFLIGMCEGVFPDYRATTKKEISEERNNAFVAVTRAKRWLYITYPKLRLMPWGDYKTQLPSRFLNEISKQ